MAHAEGKRMMLRSQGSPKSVGLLERHIRDGRIQVPFYLRLKAG